MKYSRRYGLPSSVAGPPAASWSGSGMAYGARNLHKTAVGTVQLGIGLTLWTIATAVKLWNTILRGLRWLLANITDILNGNLTTFFEIAKFGSPSLTSECGGQRTERSTRCRKAFRRYWLKPYPAFHDLGCPDQSTSHIFEGSEPRYGTTCGFCWPDLFNNKLKVRRSRSLDRPL